MQQIDVVVLLKKLSSKEIKDFHTYLRNRVRKDSKALKLLAYLRRYHPQLDEAKVNFEKVSKHLSIKPALVSNTLSDIRIQLRKFLTERYLETAPFEQDRILLQVYRDYRLSQLFDKQLKAMKKSLEKERPKDLWYDLKQMQLEHERYYYVGTTRWNSNVGIQNAMEYLDRFYAAAKLTYSSELVNRVQILDEAETTIRLKEETALMSFDHESNYHRFYRMAFRLIQSRSTDLYFELKEVFTKEYILLSKNDQFIILSYLLNHASFETSKGKDEFVREFFSLSQFGIQDQIFIINGIFDPNHFLNAIEVASKLQHFDWAWDFIAQWSSTLDPDKKDYYVSLGIALIHFKRKDYEACSDVLAPILLKSPLDEQRGMLFVLISLYESNCAPDFILSRCTTIKQFVRSNRFINKDRRKGILLVVRVLEMLLKPQPDKGKISQLLQTSNNFHYKSWLLQKVEELK